MNFIVYIKHSLNLRMIGIMIDIAIYINSQLWT